MRMAAAIVPLTYIPLEVNAISVLNAEADLREQPGVIGGPQGYQACLAPACPNPEGRRRRRAGGYLAWSSRRRRAVGGVDDLLGVGGHGPGPHCGGRHRPDRPDREGPIRYLLLHWAGVARLGPLDRSRSPIRSAPNRNHDPGPWLRLPNTYPSSPELRFRGCQSFLISLDAGRRGSYFYF